MQFQNQEICISFLDFFNCLKVNKNFINFIEDFCKYQLREQRIPCMLMLSIMILQSERGTT